MCASMWERKIEMFFFLHNQSIFQVICKWQFSTNTSHFVNLIWNQVNQYVLFGFLLSQNWVFFFFSFIEWKQDFFLFLFFPFDMRIELNCCFHFNWMSLTRFICFFLYVVMFIFTFSKSNLLLVLLLGEKKKKSRKIEWSSAVMAID